MPDSDTGRRTALSDRLDLLLSTSTKSSPRSSLDDSDIGPHEHGLMHRTRSAASVNKLPAAANPRPNSTRIRPASVHAQVSSDTSSPNSPPVPVLRWLSNLYTGHSHSPLSPTPSFPASSSPPSPGLALLKDALREPLLPAVPPQAKLPDSFQAPRSLSRPPPFLDNLTRSTLPTASLSQPLRVSTLDHSPPTPPSPCSSDPLRSPPIVLTHSPPTRSSLDTLRSVSIRDHDRAFHTAAATAATAVTSTSVTESPSPVSWWWFQSENKEDVDRLLHEDDRGDTVQQEQANIKKKYRSPRNPVVFCHGLLGFDSVTIGPAIAPLQVTHWRGIKEVLEANDTEVLITRVPATSSPVDRAKVLEEKISEVYPGRSVHLIGHSMGGLDCRYLTTHLTHRKFHVLSVTTIATPHRGSSFADHFLSTVGRARMPSVLSLLDLLPNGGGDGKAFECLTIGSMKKFNEETPDVEGVRYFSWGAVYEPGLIDTWKWPHSVILEKEGPNDGLVSVESSKWGTYLGTLSHVNHLDLVGWINTARYKWAEMMGKEIKFRPATFYLGIADMLAREVEGQGGEEEDDDDGQKAGKGAVLEEAGGVDEGGVNPTPEKLIEESAGGETKQEEEQARAIESLTNSGASVEEPSKPSRFSEPNKNSHSQGS